MAQPDGAVRIDTSLNLNAFNQGIERMVRAMSHLSDVTEKLGKTIDRAFDGYVRTLQGAANAVRPVAAATDNAAQKTEALSGAASKAADSYGKVSEKASAAKTALDGISEAEKRVNSSAASGGAGLSASLTPLQRKFSAMNALIDETSEKYRTAFSSGDMGDLKSIQTGVERASAATRDFQRRVEEFEKTQFYTDEYARIEKDIRNAESALNELYKKRKEMGLENARLEDGKLTLKQQDIPPEYKTDFGRYVAVASEVINGIREAEGKLADFQRQRDELARKGGVFTGAETEQAKAYAEGVARANAQLSALRENVRKSAEAQGLAGGVEKAERELENYRAKAEKMGELGATKKQWESVAYDVRLATEKVAEYRAQAEALRDSGAIRDEDYQRLNAALEQAEVKAVSAAGQISELRGSLKGLAKDESLIHFDESQVTVSDELSAPFENVAQSVGEAETALEGYQKELEAIKSSGADVWERSEFTAKIQTAAQNAADLKARLDELHDGGKIDQKQYDDLSKRLTDLQESYSKLKESAKPSYMQDWQNAVKLSDMFSNALVRMEGKAWTALNSIVHPIQALDRALGAVMQTAVRAGQALLQIGKSAVVSGFQQMANASARAGAELLRLAGSSVLSGLRAISDGASEAARNIGKMASRAITAGIKRLGAWLSNAAKSMTLFNKAAKRNNGVLKKSFTTFLKYGLGVRSFYFLFRKVRSAIATGFQNLAQYSDNLNVSISKVISNFKQFENQFAATFEPLVNAVAPAIAKIIAALTEGTFRAGEFFAALNGQKVVTRAKEVEEDYAASLDKEKEKKAKLKEETRKAIAEASEYADASDESAESLEEETDAAKKLERQLAGFDELNILKVNKEDETDADDLFEEVPLDFEAQDFADRFKQMWEDADLTELGGILGGKIKVAFDSIPWPDIQKGAEDMGKRLATFLDGLINVPDLGKSLGKALAEAINAAFAFLDVFVWNFDWKGLGNAIMDTVEGFVDNLDWKRIRHAMLGLAYGLADLLNAIFARKKVWEKIGVTIGKAVNAAVDAGLAFFGRFDPEKAGASLSAALNKVVETVNWENLGRLFGEALGTIEQFLYQVFADFDWIAAGEAFASGVNGFVDTLRERTKDLNWDEIGTNVAEGVNAAVRNIQWDELGALLGGGFQGAIGFFASFIRGLSWADITAAVKDFLRNALREIDFYDLITVYAVAGAITAIKTIIASHPVTALIVAAIWALGAEFGEAINRAVDDFILWIEGINFNEIATAFITPLNEAIAAIDWGDIGRAFADGFGDALEFLRTAVLEFDWLTLGESFAAGFNEFVGVLLSKIARFEWGGMGIAIADGMNAAVEGIDWHSFGALVGRLIGGAFTFVASLIRELDFSEISESIKQFLISAISRIDFNDMLTVYGVGALLFALKTLIAQHPVLTLLTGVILALGPSLGNVIHRMCTEIDWAGVGKTVGDFFKDALGRLNDAVESVDWHLIGVKVGEFLGSIDWAGIIGEVIELILNIIANAFVAIVGVIQGVGPLKILGAIAALISTVIAGIAAKAAAGAILLKAVAIVNGIFTAIVGAIGAGPVLIGIAIAGLIAFIIGQIVSHWDELVKAGADLISGFFKGITDFFVNIGSWVKEHIFDPFLNAIKDLFGIHSPSTVMEEQGGYVIEGLLKGITDAWGGIVEFFGGALDGLITTLGGAWETITTAASNAWEGVKTATAEKWEQISSALGKTWENVKTAASEKFDAVKKTVGDSWETIKKGASEKLGAVTRTASEKWREISTGASAAWGEVKTTVGNAVSNVKEEATRKVSEIVTETKSKWDRIKADASNGWNGVKSSIIPKAQDIKTQVLSAFQGLQGTLSGIWGGIRSAASGALSSVSATVSSMVSSISSRVSSIRSTVSNITSSASDALSKVADKMDDLTRKGANGVGVGGLASGGFVTDGGKIRSWYDTVRKYASGTARAAGSLFVAGEAGPEIVGHVNGRTEVLNQSQIASAIYGAVLSAMSEAAQSFGGWLSQQLASNTNALIAAIGQIQMPQQIAVPQDTALTERLAALQAVPYQVPAYATGTVMPYEVVAEIRRSTDRITGCIDGNAEEIIQAFISAIASQTASLNSALSALSALTASGGQQETSFSDFRDAVNRQTIMFGKSPFYG